MKDFFVVVFALLSGICLYMKIELIAIYCILYAILLLELDK